MSSLELVPFLANPTVWVCASSFFVFGLLASLVWFWRFTLVRLGIRKKKFDPLKLIREEVAKQIELEMKPSYRYPDPLAVWGTTEIDLSQSILLIKYLVVRLRSTKLK